jgi:serine protease Do
MTVLQTDAAIDGMSFSIPTYIALPIIEDLEENGCVSRPVLGISLHNLYVVSEVRRIELKIPQNLRRGVFVDSVVEGSFAYSMGIKVGDVLLQIGDEDIEDTASFRQSLFDYRDGDELSISLVRLGYAHHLIENIDLAE